MKHLNTGCSELAKKYILDLPKDHMIFMPKILIEKCHLVNVDNKNQ